MSSKNPIISIVVPTYNRCDELIFLIDSINNQKLDPKYFELIICDDGSTDDTKNIIFRREKTLSYNLKYLYQKNHGPAAARNNGVKISKGELIVFTDSDCEPDEYWLQNIFKEYKEDTFDAFGGPDHAKNDFLPIQKAIDFAMSSFFTTGGMRGHNENMFAKFYPRTHNMGIKKKIFENVGGFGQLRFGEDIEFSNRVYKIGSKVKLFKNIIVYHRRRVSLAKYFKQVYNSGVARINLGKIDKDLLEFIHFIPAFITILSISIICGSFIYPGIYKYLILIGSMALVFLSIIGGNSKKSINVMFLLNIVIPIQIFGYGLGFIVAFIKRNIFNQDEFSGFKKNFY